MKNINLLSFVIVLMLNTNAQYTWRNDLLHGQESDINSVYFFEANTGYVIGDNGTILKTTNAKNTRRDALKNSPLLKIYHGYEIFNQQTKNPTKQIDISNLPQGVSFEKFIKSK